MTFFLAVTAGLSPERARTIALATQYIDDNPATEPLQLGLETKLFFETNDAEEERLREQIYRIRFSYHFTYSETELAFESSVNWPDPVVRASRPWNDQLRNLLAASQRAPTVCAEAQFYGEFLHAFQDTFSHRHPDGRPISVDEDFRGHLQYSTDPDKTYDVGQFTSNDEHTLVMQEEVFGRLQRDFEKFGLYANESYHGFPIAFDEIRGTLVQFNAIQGMSGFKGEETRKIAFLNDELKKLGFEGVDLTGAHAYNEAVASVNRRNYLRGLNPVDYPGTIFP
jgi:hypothetical protein